jgi:hypothetical protein
MTSLSEVYGDRRGGPGLRRLYLGVGLFLVGCALAVCAIVVGTTGALRGFGVGLFGERKIAGVLGGVGVPAVLLGVFTVLPTSNRNKAAAVVGAAVCLLGVALFAHAYPTYWVGSSAATDYTLPVTGVYFLGLLTAVWSLFVGVVNFKTRNDPGGTVDMTVERQGRTRIVTVPERVSSAMGGVGLLGGTPDGDVETQTNRDAGGAGETTSRSGAGAASTSTAGTGRTTAAGDGGTATETLSTPGTKPTDAADAGPEPSVDGDARDAVFLDDNPEPSRADSYCGNCQHFEYVRTERGMQPYCGAHEELMDDMEACEQWAPNSDGGKLPDS